MKKDSFAKATKVVKKKEQPEIKVSDELKKLVLLNTKRKDVRLIAEKYIDDISDEGDYRLVDMNGNVLFQLLINPYTIRLLKDGKLVGETHIVPVRNGMDDDVIIPDDNMAKICETIYSLYEHRKPVRQTTKQSYVR